MDPDVVTVVIVTTVITFLVIVDGVAHRLLGRPGAQVDVGVDWNVRVWRRWKICFHSSMRLSQRRLALRQVTTAAVAALVLVLVAWLLTYSRSTGSRQYVSGAAGQQGSVSVGTRAVDLYARQGGAKSQADISDTCFYKTGRGVVMVPIHVRGRGEGAMTFHATTMIAKDGTDGGRVVRSVFSDVPFMGTMLSEQIWARIPLDHSVWNGGATHCRVRWTMTPGAWFTED